VKIRTIFIVSIFAFVGLFVNSCERFAESCPIFSALPEKDQLKPGNVILLIGEGGGKREVILHLPPSYDSEKMFPLLIVFHGAGQDGAEIQELTGIDSYADQFGFVVAYPNGSGRPGSNQLSWNAKHCCGYALENNVDDVGFIDSLIDLFISQYPIDPDRVFLAGLSNGGMMAYRAGAELADKIAGIAPVAASLGGRLTLDGELILPDAPTTPVAVIAFHGLRDTRILYDGGISSPEGAPTGFYTRSDLSAIESITFWVEANGCQGDPLTETSKDGLVIIDRYTNCQGNADVELVSLVEGCHEWPTASSDQTSVLPSSHTVCANQMMLEFFQSHPKQ
jgi:polyhydroxybutyrate depolymerase